MNDAIAPDLAESLRRLEVLLSRDVNTDMNCRRTCVFQTECAVFFLDGMCSSDQLQHYILMPVQQHAGEALPGDVEGALLSILPVGETETVRTFQDLTDGLMDGKAVLLCEGLAGALCIDIRSYVRRGVSQPLTESVVTGPHQGFNESLRDNVTLLRRIFHTPRLIAKMQTVGTMSPVNISIIYLKGIVSETSLRRVEERLAQVQIDHLLSIGALSQLLEDRPFALLPQSCLTERPDRAASFLREGQVVVLMDGAPQALCMPVTLLHLFHTSEDTALRWPYGSFLRCVRLAGMLLTWLLPGAFIALLLYHPDAMALPLLTSVLEGQAGVPLSLPMQMFLMLLMFDLINEAGTRAPGIVGTSLGTVSGLILGSAAVDASLVHPLLIIVVAVSSLGSYAIPDHSLALAFRMAQLGMLLAGCAAGLYGMAALALITCARVCTLESLGAPFAAPLSPSRPCDPDLLLRLPLWRQRLRTWLADPAAMLRVQGRMRGRDHA